MKEIKISTGTVIIKDICTRKLKKEINKALYADVALSTSDDGKTNLDGFSMEALDNANDAALLGMIEKIVIDGNEVPISIEVIDNLSTSDFDKIYAEVNSILNAEIPKN